MIDMNACSLIFDRPWQYDMDVKQIGKDNLYKIRKNNVNYTLLPLKRESNLKSSKVYGEVFLTITILEPEMQAKVQKISRFMHWI